MNALFATVIKVFLALMEAHDAVGQDDGDGADGGHCRDMRWGAVVHGCLYRPKLLDFPDWCPDPLNWVVMKPVIANSR